MGEWLSAAVFWLLVLAAALYGYSLLASWALEGRSGPDVLGWLILSPLLALLWVWGRIAHNDAPLGAGNGKEWDMAEQGRRPQSASEFYRRAMAGGWRGILRLKLEAAKSRSVSDAVTSLVEDGVQQIHNDAALEEAAHQEEVRMAARGHERTAMIEDGYDAAARRLGLVEASAPPDVPGPEPADPFSARVPDEEARLGREVVRVLMALGPDGFKNGAWERIRRELYKTHPTLVADEVVARVLEHQRLYGL